MSGKILPNLPHRFGINTPTLAGVRTLICYANPFFPPQFASRNVVCSSKTAPSTSLFAVETASPTISRDLQNLSNGSATHQNTVGVIRPL